MGFHSKIQKQRSQHRILSTDSKVNTNAKYIVPCESTAEVVSFEW